MINIIYIFRKSKLFSEISLLLREGDKENLLVKIFLAVLIYPYMNYWDREMQGGKPMGFNKYC